MLDARHKYLEVYKTELQLVKEIYRATRSFPKEEQFVLATQLRRAAIFVCSNMLKDPLGVLKLKGNDFMR